MAFHIIHEDEHPVTLGPVWRVVQDPLNIDALGVVVFTMHSGRGLEFKGIAHWVYSLSRWARNLWVPAPPQVPPTLLKVVEDHLKQKPQS